MLRQTIISSIGRAVETLGYSFQPPAACAPKAQISQLPAATIAPLKIVSTEGRKEPRVTYRVVLTLLSPHNFADADRESLWSVMERDAIEVYRVMELSPAVCGVSNFSAMPASRPLTRFGDCSLTAEFDVEAIYCIE